MRDAQHAPADQRFDGVAEELSAVRVDAAHMTVEGKLKQTDACVFKQQLIISERIHIRIEQRTILLALE